MQTNDVDYNNGEYKICLKLNIHKHSSCSTDDQCKTAFNISNLISFIAVETIKS